jgi:hypothetical protein
MVRGAPEVARLAVAQSNMRTGRETCGSTGRCGDRRGERAAALVQSEKSRLETKRPAHGVRVSQSTVARRHPSENGLRRPSSTPPAERAQAASTAATVAPSRSCRAAVDRDLRTGDEAADRGCALPQPSPRPRLRSAATVARITTRAFRLKSARFNDRFSGGHAAGSRGARRRAGRARDCPSPRLRTSFLSTRSRATRLARQVRERGCEAAQ